jgi:hypothetical protein
MAQILEERGHSDACNQKAQCGKKFLDCPDKATDCCCCRLLFNEPDFAHIDSILETEAQDRGFEVIFLPKFHCTSAKNYFGGSSQPSYVVAVGCFMLCRAW